MRPGAAGGAENGLPAAAAVGKPGSFCQPIRSLQQVQPHPHCVVTETGAATQNPDGNLTPSTAGFNPSARGQETPETAEFSGGK